MNEHLQSIRRRLIEVGVPDQELIVAVIAYDELRHFGSFADEYVDVLLDVAADDATIVMNAFTWNVCETGRYHHADTPGEVGLASEVFRRSDGVKRSHHPIFSLTAIGPLSDLVLAHDGPTCWGDGTPAEVLVAKNAFNVSIGKEFPRATTVLHSFEEWRNLPYREFETFCGEADFGSGFEPYETEFFVPKDPSLTYNWRPLVELMAQRGLVRGTDFELPVRACYTADLARGFYDLADQDPYAFVAKS